MEVRDYEHKLKMEISENENRKELTVSEKLAYAREIERIERAKAAERSASNLKQNTECDNCHTREKSGRTNDIVAQAVGFSSGRNYERAKFAVENALPETITKLDAGEISINKAYNQVKYQRENTVKPTVGNGGGEISVHAACNETKRQTQIPAPTHAKVTRPVLTILKSATEADAPACELKALLADFQAYLEEFERRFSNLVSRIPDLYATGIDFNSSLRAYRNVLVLVDSSIKLKRFVEKKAGCANGNQ